MEPRRLAQENDYQFQGCDLKDMSQMAHNFELTSVEDQGKVIMAIFLDTCLSGSHTMAQDKVP